MFYNLLAKELKSEVATAVPTSDSEVRAAVPTVNCNSEMYAAVHSDDVVSTAVRTGGEVSTAVHTLGGEVSTAVQSHQLIISEFYAKVTLEYYKVEPFVHHVNMVLTEEERTVQSFTKFGVLGSAHGISGEAAETSIRTFFLGNNLS